MKLCMSCFLGLAKSQLTELNRWRGINLLTRAVCGTTQQQRRRKYSKFESSGTSSQDAVKKLLLKHPFIETQSPSRPSHYILHREIADEVAEAVKKYQDPKADIIVEANPGPGVLTNAFINSGFEHVVGLEARHEFIPELVALQDKVGSSRFSYLYFDLFTLWRRDSSSTESRLYANSEAEVVKCMASQSVGNNKHINVFGTLSSIKESGFIVYMIKKVFLQEGFFSTGEMQWFLFVSAKLRSGLLNIDKGFPNLWLYKSLQIFITNFFHHEIIMEVPSCHFYPSFKIPRNAQKYFDVDLNKRYLLRLTPKTEVERIIPAHEVDRYLVFLYQMSSKRLTRLIPKIEYLVPGCGMHLLKNGFSMTQLMGEIPPQDFLHIYKLVTEIPEFQESPLHCIIFGKTEHFGQSNEDVEKHPPKKETAKGRAKKQ